MKNNPIQVREKKHLFSLIELLIVIAIIAILAALLLPALNSVKERARSAKCVSNLKPLGTAHAIYSDSYNDYLIQNGPTNTNRWMHQLDPFLHTIDWTKKSSAHPRVSVLLPVLECPSDPHFNYTFKNTGELENGNNNPSYGLNNFAQGKKRSRVKNPGRKIHMTGTMHSRVPGAPAANNDSPSYIINMKMVTNRHKGGASILWMDFHVSFPDKTLQLMVSSDWTSSREKFWKPLE